MNYFFIIALMFFGMSCSNQDLPENEELMAVEYRGLTTEQEETQEIFELDLRQNYVLGQLAILDDEKKKLKEKIEEGREDLIPNLELNMKNFRQFEDQLFNLQEIICYHLKVKAEKLAARAHFDADAKRKLLAMDEVLKSCGIEVSYSYWIGDYSLPAPRLGKTKTVGGCKMPGRDLEACDLPLIGGKHKLIVDDKLNSLILTTEDGKTIDEARFLGESKNMIGFFEYEIDLPFEVNSKVSLVVSKENLKYDVPIRISEGF